MQKTYISFELANGETRTVRLTMREKIGGETIARHGGWSMEQNQIKLQAVWAWLAAKNLNLTTAKFEDFMEKELVDAVAVMEDTSEDLVEENPTLPA